MKNGVQYIERKDGGISLRNGEHVVEKEEMKSGRVWWACHTCGDEGGPFLCHEQADDSIVDHHNEQVRGTKRPETLCYCYVYAAPHHPDDCAAYVARHEVK